MDEDTCKSFRYFVVPLVYMFTGTIIYAILDKTGDFFLGNLFSSFLIAFVIAFYSDAISTFLERAKEAQEEKKKNE